MHYLEKYFYKVERKPVKSILDCSEYHPVDEGILVANTQKGRDSDEGHRSKKVYRRRI